VNNELQHISEEIGSKKSESSNKMSSSFWSDFVELKLISLRQRVLALIAVQRQGKEQKQTLTLHNRAT
jgi:hypothetical protein